MLVVRKVVSRTLAKGRWIRTMGLNLSITGHPLDTIRIPKMELNPFCIVVSLK